MADDSPLPGRFLHDTPTRIQGLAGHFVVAAFHREKMTTDLMRVHRPEDGILG